MSASAQAFSSESLHVSAGFGIGGYLSYVSYGNFTNSPALFLAVEKGTNIELGPGTVGIGGFAAYKTAGYTYEYFESQMKLTGPMRWSVQGRLAPEYTGE